MIEVLSERHVRCPVLDLLPDFVIPGIAPAQLALVEPNLDARRRQRIANALRRLGILRGVAPETPRAMTQPQ